jgi:preprotein translocase subunit SecG
MRWSIVSIVAAVAIAVIGGVLVQMSPWAGLISIASIGSLFALLPEHSRWQGIRLCPSL